MIEIKKRMNEEEINEFIKNLIPQLTIKEKVYLMSGHHFFKFLFKDRKVGARPYPGGGIERFDIPPFLFTDGPRGVVIPGSTCFPVSIARAATWDIDLEEKVGEIIGKEARAHGANLFGGVCINLLRHPAWGRAQETYGEDPFLLGEMGASLIRGVQKHNVMATIKHFLANSIEYSRFKVNILMDERTLQEIYLPHFKKCIEEGCATVMTAYNKFRGEYCSQNTYLLRKILKGDWNFQGFVHSDWMYGLHDTIKGVYSGLDVEMPRSKYYGRKLKKKIKKGKIPIELIDESVKRIIRTVLLFTTKEDPQKYDKNLIGCEQHIRLAREVAEKSMVLLKNKNNILPFNTKEIKKLVIIGELANLKNTGDHGSSYVRQSNIITHLQGIQDNMGSEINIIYNNGSSIKTAKEIAKTADAVLLVIGYTYKDEGEYIGKGLRKIGDRLNLGLKPKDIQLIKTISQVSSRCVVALIGGSAILMEEWRDLIPAILMVWYSGMEGGHALADILFGKINPSGKLPFTIPKDASDLPFFKARIDEIEYGYYHGYAKFNKEKIEPAFPFGFGLSYTQYEYKNLQVNPTKDKIIANVDITNLGQKAGEEIAQLYVGFENSKVDRPFKLLKGFTRVRLLPDETKNAKIEINKNDLAYYNPELKSWEIEKMKYSIYVGASSKSEDLLKTEILIG